MTAIKKVAALGKDGERAVMALEETFEKREAFFRTTDPVRQLLGWPPKVLIGQRELEERDFATENTISFLLDSTSEPYDCYVYSLHGRHLLMLISA